MHLSRVTLGKMQNPVRGILHGTAAVLAVLGTVVLILRTPTWPSRLAVLVFGAGLLALYTTSSLYHSIAWREEWKRRMQRADHSMIFVLIAATYTPIALIALDGIWTWGTLVVVWGMALIGITHKVVSSLESNVFPIVLMVTMGWVSLPLMFPLAQRTGILAVVLLAAGGILYTVGMVFLVTGWPRLWPRVFGHHELFHVFVVAASALHYAVTFRYVVPLAG